jgi:hypothetical protein
LAPPSCEIASLRLSPFYVPKAYRGLLSYESPHLGPAWDSQDAPRRWSWTLSGVAARAYSGQSVTVLTVLAARSARSAPSLLGYCIRLLALSRCSVTVSLGLRAVPLQRESFCDEIPFQCSRSLCLEKSSARVLGRATVDGKGIG